LNCKNSALWNLWGTWRDMGDFQKVG